MEIEAKYGIPDEQTFRRLQETPTLAGLDLGPVTTLDLHDTYLDTPNWWLYRAGAACRLRTVQRKSLLALRSLSAAGELTAPAEELEELLPGPPPRFRPSHGTVRAPIGLSSRSLWSGTPWRETSTASSPWGPR